ncbi:DNA-protecting protein DprA [Rhodobacteraceae bacterium]|nr:DNA-protecting protein DprA [Paracoccaceae bacterium]
MKADLFSNTTPFTPPTTVENDLPVLRLFRSRRVGATTFHRLIAEYGSAAAALAHLPDIARNAGVHDYHICSEASARAEIRAGHKLGARLLCFGAPGYPAALMDLPDAPPVLWALGNLDLLTRPALGFVGARNASSLGRRMAGKLATEAGAAGYVVISGLARGIDAQAHRAALPTGTIAVQGGGIDTVYPRENAALHDDLARNGLRLSEMPPGTTPQARHFPQRNRIIAGLSRAVIVIEAATRSGSLITARDALDQGREVMAVPGHPMDGRTGGCNQLIRDGAVLIRSFDDIAEALGPAAVTQACLPTPTVAPTPDPRPQPLPQAAPASQMVPSEMTTDAPTAITRILQRLSVAPVPEDTLIRDLHLSPSLFAQAICELEMDLRIERLPGGLIARL